jgi:hypothetical protein
VLLAEYWLLISGYWLLFHRLAADASGRRIYQNHLQERSGSLKLRSSIQPLSQDPDSTNRTRFQTAQIQKHLALQCFADPPNLSQIRFRHPAINGHEGAFSFRLGGNSDHVPEPIASRMPETGFNGRAWLNPLILREKQRKLALHLPITNGLLVDMPPFSGLIGQPGLYFNPKRYDGNVATGIGNQSSVISGQ